jgi:hypothetical protein
VINGLDVDLPPQVVVNWITELAASSPGHRLNPRGCGVVTSRFLAYQRPAAQSAQRSLQGWAFSARSWLGLVRVSEQK